MFQWSKDISYFSVNNFSYDKTCNNFPLNNLTLNIIWVHYARKYRVILEMYQHQNTFDQHDLKWSLLHYSHSLRQFCAILFALIHISNFPTFGYTSHCSLIVESALKRVTAYVVYNTCITFQILNILLSVFKWVGTFFVFIFFRYAWYLTSYWMTKKSQRIYQSEKY